MWAAGAADGGAVRALAAGGGGGGSVNRELIRLRAGGREEENFLRGDTPVTLLRAILLPNRLVVS